MFLWDLRNDSKWPALHTKLETWSGENAYLKIPVLKYIFVPGIYLWCYLLLVGYLLIYKKWKWCVPLSFIAGYYVTLLLGPTVQLRYLYPVMVTLPFFVFFCTKQESGKDGEKEKN